MFYFSKLSTKRFSSSCSFHFPSQIQILFSPLCSRRTSTCVNFSTWETLF